MRLLYIAVLALAAVGLARAAGKPVPIAPVQTVPKVDISRYVGKWYEIARFPMFFQRNCVGDTTAEYAVNPNGTIAVFNSCRDKKGADDAAEGEATVVPGSNNTKLRVSFFKPFKGDYWVIGLDPDYRWAVVGTPNRKYLWILSRTPRMSEIDKRAALAAASAQGYRFEKLMYTPQSTH